MLHPDWQLEQIKVMEEVFGSDRVIVGQEGFASLTAPQQVGAAE